MDITHACKHFESIDFPSAIYIFYICICIYINICTYMYYEAEARIRFIQSGSAKRAIKLSARIGGAYWKKLFPSCFLTALETSQMLQLFRLNRANGVSFFFSVFYTNETETRERRCFPFVLSLGRTECVYAYCCKFRTFVRDLLKWSIFWNIRWFAIRLRIFVHLWEI